MSLEGWSFN